MSTSIEPKNMEIPLKYQKAGSAISVFCKGNNPLLDCRVSGSWIVH